MRTEEYLQSARDMKFRVDDLERVQSSPRQDALENQVIRIIERMEQIDKKLISTRARLIAKRHDIRNKICRMKEGQSRRFLMDYYIECKSWQQIFDEYHYTKIESAYNLKVRAIKDFDNCGKIKS